MTEMFGNRKKKYFIVSLLSVCMLGMAGCGKKPVELVLTTGLRSNEIFRLENVSCTLAEARVYLVNEQNRYEKVYGTEIWEDEVSGGELEERLKEKVLAEISQVKAMTLLAEEKEVVLNEEELQKTETAAAQYMESLNDTEVKVLEMTQELAAEMYRDYAMADKVYHQIIAGINPEISDDEARIITVQNILIPFSDENKTQSYQTAQEVYRKAMDGESFELLMEKYNESGSDTVSVGKGEMDPYFEATAFSLEKEEISGVIETARGYEIIKCLNKFDREETDRNKLKIMEKRRAEVFGQEYDEFVKSLVGELNQELWDSIALESNQEVNTADFFEIYHEIFDAE